MDSASGVKMALEKEMDTYKKKLAELRAQHEGKFVLIHGEEIVDTFSTYEDAIKSGYQKFNNESFLVKRIYSTEPTLFVSRLLPLSEPVQ